MARAFHLVILPANGPTRHVALGTSAVRIGSGGDAEVHLADPELAAVHARIEPREGGYVLVREALPLLVNGLRTKAHVLSPHDLVVLGKNAIAFRPGPPPGGDGFAFSAGAGGGAGAGAGGGVELGSMRRLRALAERVWAKEDPAALAEQLVADVLALTGASRGTLVRFTSDDDPERVVTSTQGSFTGGEVAFSRTVLARMRDEGRAVVIADTTSDTTAFAAESLVGEAALGVAAIPIAREGRLLGALYVSGRAGKLGPREVELLELYAGLAVLFLESERRIAVLAAQLTALGEADDADGSLLVGASPAMRALRRTLRKVATSKAPVLVTGETGTGKELVARELHRLSPRARGPFVAVNCGAIPHDLLASELFGHVKGAFTQAHRDRAGHFRSADGGTLFLDEIGEMPLAQQVALLRVLQEGQVTPVGAETSVPLDVRVVCATNRALDAEIAAGRFRQDLFFRVAVVAIHVPPLRDRGADVVLLAQHFLRAHAKEIHAHDIRFSDDALDALGRARWDGNVRELEASVRRAVLLREAPVLEAGDLGLAANAVDAGHRGDAGAVVRPLAMARDEFLRGYVKDVVARFGGNRTAAADALVVTARTVFKYLEE